MFFLLGHLSLHDVHLIHTSTQINSLRCLATLLLPRHLHCHLLHNHRPDHSYAGATQTDGHSFRHNVDASKLGPWSVPSLGRHAPVDLTRQPSLRIPPANPLLLPGKLHMYGSILDPKERRLDIRQQAGRKRLQKAIPEEGPR